MFDHNLNELNEETRKEQGIPGHTEYTVGRSQYTCDIKCPCSDEISLFQIAHDLAEV